MHVAILLSCTTIKTKKFLLLLLYPTSPVPPSTLQHLFFIFFFILQVAPSLLTQDLWASEDPDQNFIECLFPNNIPVSPGAIDRIEQLYQVIAVGHLLLDHLVDHLVKYRPDQFTNRQHNCHIKTNHRLIFQACAKHVPNHKFAKNVKLQFGLALARRIYKRPKFLAVESTECDFRITEVV